MSRVVDTLIVVDAAKILADHGTSQNDDFTALKNGGLGYVFMVAPWLNVGQPAAQQQGAAQTFEEEEGGNELQLLVKVGDVVRMRARCLAGPGDNQCLISNVSLDPQTETHITGFTPALRSIATTAIDPTAGLFTKYMPTSGQDYCWEAVTLMPATIKYNLDFTVYNGALQKQGGFSFQSQIVINA
ncbi:AidA/PixA family protein [Bordetella genomosp. 9]|uniref:Inclusion body protein n=1 Tax=Bordetella genomosp. 9 TaxID=1416803 RepID=A0A1W6YVL3_9BORD|nr:AidA/PixA family protein [Bordetella genomosp. 9]ARP85024.1 hypothetical protein CAL13_01385 [Bordetella genomosp. 9]